MSFSSGIAFTYFYRLDVFPLVVVIVLLLLLSFKWQHLFPLLFFFLGVFYTEARFPALLQHHGIKIEGTFEVRGSLASSERGKFYLSKYLRDGVYMIAGTVAEVPKDKRGYLWSRGYWKMIDVESSNPLSSIEDPYLKRLKELYPEDVASFIYGALFGDKRGIPRSVKEPVYRAGIGHLLAVSGLHVGLLAGAFLVALSLLGLSPRTAIMLSLVPLTFYVYVIGPQPSAMRAYLMLLLCSIGKLLGLRVNTLNLLGASGLALEIWNPFMFWDIGFELSFAAFFFIALALEFRLPLYLLYISPQLGTLPLLAFYFKYVPIASFLSNLFAIPLFSVALPLAVLSLAPLLGEFLAPMVRFMIELLFFIAVFFDKLLPSLNL